MVYHLYEPIDCQISFETKTACYKYCNNIWFILDLYWFVLIDGYLIHILNKSLSTYLNILLESVKFKKEKNMLGQI